MQVLLKKEFEVVHMQKRWGVMSSARQHARQARRKSILLLWKRRGEAARRSARVPPPPAALRFTKKTHILFLFYCRVAGREKGAKVVCVCAVCSAEGLSSTLPVQSSSRLVIGGYWEVEVFHCCRLSWMAADAAYLLDIHYRRWYYTYYFELEMLELRQRDFQRY